MAQNNEARPRARDIGVIVGTLPTGQHRFIDLRAAAGDRLATLPWCLRVLLENALRTSEPAGADDGCGA